MWRGQTGCSGEVIEHRDGGEPSIRHRSPGQTRFEPITLERGVTHDHAFEAWANQVWQLGAAIGNESSLATFRKDIRIEMCNEAGQVVLAYVVYRAWPSLFEALPDLDATTGATAIESIVLEHEGWQRDLAVTEPVEPSYS